MSIKTYLLGTLMTYIDTLAILIPTLQLCDCIKKMTKNHWIIILILAIQLTFISELKEYIKWNPLIIQVITMITFAIIMLLICYRLSNKIIRSIIASSIGLLVIGFGIDFIGLIYFIIKYKVMSIIMGHIVDRLIYTVIASTITLILTYIAYKNNKYIKIDK